MASSFETVKNVPAAEVHNKKASSSDLEPGLNEGMQESCCAELPYLLTIL